MYVCKTVGKSTVGRKMSSHPPISEIPTPPGILPTDASDLEGLGAEKIRLIQEKMGGRRPAFTSEIAGVVAMLCTEDAAWCTGSVVNANGGMKMTT